jgi:ubiquinone/menaquinone biosynthesis C-methylase UbiE
MNSAGRSTAHRAPPDACTAGGAVQQPVANRKMTQTAQHNPKSRRRSAGDSAQITEGFIIRSFSERGVVCYYADAVEGVGLWDSERTIFGRYLKPGDKILDIGCGAGRTTIGLYREGFKNVEGVDVSPAMIEEGRAIARRLGANITFSVGNACRLAYVDESFDGVIFSFNGLMQIPGAEGRLRAVEEVRRILKKGGYFIFTTNQREQGHEFWQQQRKVWAEGIQDPRLIEFGDVILRGGEHKEGYLHFPTIAEVHTLIRRSGLRLIYSKSRKEICRDSEAIDRFAGDCTFWVTKK